jgi:hypothetical protein
MRKLKIEDFNPAGRLGGVGASMVRLKGAWLKRAGFHPGASVTVSCVSPGVIELRVCSPVALSGESFTGCVDRMWAKGGCA